MTDEVHTPRPTERIPTGIAGLDTITHGGFVSGGTYIIAGGPGTGKTVLANQICFTHAAAGGRAVYITLLAETHARMLANMHSFTFFDPQAVATSLHYLSGYTTLQEQGLTGLLTLLRHIVRDQQAQLVVIDGLTTAEYASESELSMKRFVSELQAYAEATNSTVCMLSHHLPAAEVAPEQTMADGLLVLRHSRAELRSTRELEILKLRGSGYLEGGHFFRITDAGIQVYPRTESRLATPPSIAEEQRRPMNFAITRLDEMLNGGVLSGSSTLIMGAPGSGKTLLGLHFLAAGAQANQTGLYFGFHETPPRLIVKADQLGLHFDQFVGDGLIEVIWRAPLEHLIDELAEQMLAAVRRRNVQRLFIDGIGAFEATAIYPDRLRRFFTALTNELRALNVTTIFTAEVSELLSPTLHVPVNGLSGLADNVIFMRYFELRSQLRRMIAIIKMRDSAYDPTIREFTIAEHGIDVAEPFEDVEAILTGVSRTTPTATLRRRHSRRR